MGSTGSTLTVHFLCRPVASFKVEIHFQMSFYRCVSWPSCKLSEWGDAMMCCTKWDQLRAMSLLAWLLLSVSKFIQHQSASTVTKSLSTEQSSRCKLSVEKKREVLLFIYWTLWTATRILHWDTTDILILQLLKGSMKQCMLPSKSIRSALVTQAFISVRSLEY